MTKQFQRMLGLACVGCCLLTGCQTIETPQDTQGKKEGDSVDVNFLLSMTYSEAKNISPQSIEIPPFYKVAADEVKVLKQDETGRPLRVRAKGHVFMQVDFREQLTALGQEAYIEAGGELFVRGKPLLKRGRSVVEGLSDHTVFYISGTRLQVIGTHRFIKEESAVGGRTSFEVLPTWSRSWKEGPNPLLPALSPEDVPKELRVNPLLPLPEGADAPAMLPIEVEKITPPGSPTETKKEETPAKPAEPAKDTAPNKETQAPKPAQP
ncbi:MAG: hypothetical protein ACOYMN_19350 [Roseimicrobium sp.]